MKEARPVVNWKQVAEDDLRKYRDIEVAVTSNRETIALLTAEAEGVKAMQTEQSTRGGGKVTGDESINVLIEKMEQEQLLERNEKRLALIKQGLEGLDEEEAIALDYFYISHYRNAADKLGEILHIERSAAYKLRNRALHKYITRAYGIV